MYGSLTEWTLTANFQATEKYGPASNVHRTGLLLLPMAKDPAFLFYSSDFLVGTMAMSFEDRGKYITILSLMHQQGRLLEETIRLLVGNVSDNLRSKFAIDKDGKWFNERLEDEIAKRVKFTDSRRKNGKKGGRPSINKPSGYPNGKPKNNLTENENENENINENRVGGMGEEAPSLDETEMGATVEFVKITAKKTLRPDEVENYWQAFIINTKGEYHSSANQRRNHFRNWLKKQIQHESAITAGTGKPGANGRKSFTEAAFDYLNRD